MAYRRGRGGGGGPNRNFFNRPPNPVVNPWQGGMTPGGGVGQINTQSVLGHLSEPQAQLALALTNLLTQPQQQQMNNPPSLLSLDVNPRGGYNNNAGFRNNFSQRDVNRGRPDFRRHDNYNNKNNYRDRDVGNKKSPHPPNRHNYPNRKQSLHRSRSRDKAKDNYSAKSTETLTKKSSTAHSDKAVREDGASKTDLTVKEELASRSEPEDGVEEKRDWKAEKNTSDSNVGDDDDKKDDDDSSKGRKDGSKHDVSSSKGDRKGSSADDKDKKRNRDGKYGGIPASYLICTLCNKRMWDGESFEKHFRGRAHQQIVDSVENSYQLKANMMRESLRLEEEKKTIEMNRFKRSGKNMKQMQLSHCNMCDLQFYGHLVAHRRNVGHQRLKTFLHPKCVQCNKEFPSRMEWTTHNMTREHLLKGWQIACKLGKTDIPLEKAEEAEALDTARRDDELFEDCQDPEPENPILDLPTVGAASSGGAAGEGDADAKGGDGGAAAAEGGDAKSAEAVALMNISMRMPLYKPERIVGESCVKAVSGFHCELCPCFLVNDEERLRHLKSQRHYNAFIAELKKLQRVSMQETRSREKKRLGDDAAGDDEGNWKRRKVAAKEDEPKEGDAKKSDRYDPSDPTEEVEEEEEDEDNAENATEEAQKQQEEDGDVVADGIKKEQQVQIKEEENEDDKWAEVDKIITTEKESTMQKAVVSLTKMGVDVIDEVKTEPKAETVAKVVKEEEEEQQQEEEKTAEDLSQTSETATAAAAVVVAAADNSPSPRTTRRGGQVRNGAGPRSAKRGRRGQ